MGVGSSEPKWRTPKSTVCVDMVNNMICTAMKVAENLLLWYNIAKVKSIGINDPL